jgi:glycosyltransferase involved in cell wall biosynthesis
VATAFSTAFHVDGYRPRKGRKFYLIQGYETWLGPEERVKASWRLPLKKIVISRWLLRLVEESSRTDQIAHIPLGLDFSHFKITEPIRERSVPRVGMPAATHLIKGTRDGLAALELAKDRLPELEAVLFGTHPRSPEIPDWIEYVQLPSADELLEIYNSCQVFLYPSRVEGWGLPASEAMACGCALVATSYEGLKEFAADGETALLAPIGQPEMLAQRLIEALADDDLRIRIAEAGHEQIQRFDWDRAVDSMERLLTHQKKKI